MRGISWLDEERSAAQERFRAKKKQFLKFIRGIFIASKDFPNDSYISGCDQVSTVIRHFRKEAVSGGSSVGEVTGYMDKGICFESWQEKRIFPFSEVSRRAVGSTQPPFPLGVKRAGTWSWWLVSVYNCSPPHAFMASEGQRELCTHWWTEMLEQLKKTPNICSWWDRILRTEIRNEREIALLSPQVLRINFI
jgi:hypothetical protein